MSTIEGKRDARSSPSLHELAPLPYLAGRTLGRDALAVQVLAIAALRRHVDASQEAELARAMAQLGHLTARDQEVVRQFGQRMVDKMFHQLISRVREVAEREPAEEVLELLMQVFAVSNPPVDEAGSPAEDGIPAAQPGKRSEDE